VGRSPTATNAQDQVTSERGGPSPYRAVEPWLLLYILHTGFKDWTHLAQGRVQLLTVLNIRVVIKPAMNISKGQGIP
jgi:hypothetical protein